MQETKFFWTTFLDLVARSVTDLYDGHHNLWKYLDDTLDSAGSGCGRHVYYLSEDKVLKVCVEARPARRDDQNRCEVGVWENCDPQFRKYLPTIYAYDAEHFVWLVAEKVTPLHGGDEGESTVAGILELSQTFIASADEHLDYQYDSSSPILAYLVTGPRLAKSWELSLPAKKFRKAVRHFASLGWSMSDLFLFNMGYRESTGELVVLDTGFPTNG